MFVEESWLFAECKEMTFFLLVDSCVGGGVFDSHFPFLSARTLLGAARKSLWVGHKVALFGCVPTRVPMRVCPNDLSRTLRSSPEGRQLAWSE